jgi:hypothetical protein
MTNNEKQLLAGLKTAQNAEEIVQRKINVANGLASYAGHSFIYNRLMLQYAF